jgi:hypothetical protein
MAQPSADIYANAGLEASNVGPANPAGAYLHGHLNQLNNVPGQHLAFPPTATGVNAAQVVNPQTSQPNISYVPSSPSQVGVTTAPGATSYLPNAEGFVHHHHATGNNPHPAIALSGVNPIAATTSANATSPSVALPSSLTTTTGSADQLLVLSTEVKLSVNRIDAKLDRLTNRLEHSPWLGRDKSSSSSSSSGPADADFMSGLMVIQNIQRIVEDNDKLKNELTSKTQTIEQLRATIQQLHEKNER